MHSKFKTQTVLAIIVSLIFLHKNSFAQFYGMKATFNKMLTKQKRRKEQQFITNAMNGRPTSNFDPMAGQPDSREYTFHVVFKDSTKTEVYSRIFMDTSAGKTYLLAIDKNFPKSDPSHRERKIYADQTVSITRIASSGYLNHPVEVKGLSTDSCWMFKAITGSLNVYSYLSEYEPSPGISDFDFDSTVAIQLNDGPILKYTIDDLEKMIGQDAKALQFIQENEYFKAIKRFNKDNKNTGK